MSYLQDHFRDKPVSLVSAGVLVVLLLLPLLVSWSYNLIHPTSWFLRALLFISLYLVTLWRLCLHIKSAWGRMLLAVIAIMSFAIFSALRFASFYYQGESFNDEFFFHFNLETTRFAFSAFTGMTVAAIAYLLVVAACAGFVAKQIDWLKMDNRTFLIAPLLLISLFTDPDIANMATTGMTDSNTLNSMALSNIDFEELELDRSALFKNREDIIAGKNVVMIYMESMEQMYTDESLYPGLTPFLNSLNGEALRYTGLDQTIGTGFTVAGILSSQCGTPLLYPRGPGGNDILNNGFLKEGSCVGDILDAAGYRQVFMGGASTRFAGKGVFLSAHGYEEIYGLEELQPNLEDPGYINSWGLYDDSLLDMAKDKFDELASNSEQPFNLTVLTVDTHPPSGTVSESCKPYPEIDNSIFHSVHCTDQLVGDFVRHLQESPAWEDTVVMIMSDHLHMRNTGMEHYQEDYPRKLYLSFLNTGRTGTFDTQGAHMDVAPTILELMRVRHQQGFLMGRSLLTADRPEGISYTNPQRVAAVRYINASILSHLEVGLCEAEPLYRYENGILRVAGKEIDLSMRGRPLQMQALGTDYVLITLVDKAGKVGLTFPVFLQELFYALFLFKDSNYFLLTSHEGIAHIAPDLAPFDGLGLLFGSLKNSFEVLESNLQPGQPFALESDCGDLLSAASDVEEATDSDLAMICGYEAPDNMVWDESQGRLQLGHLSVGNSKERYDVVLNRDDQGRYVATDLKVIDLDGIQVEPGVCPAFYGNQQVLIPGVNTSRGPATMMLEKIPGVPLTFNMVKVTPFEEN